MAPKERRGELRSGTNKASQTTRHPQWIRKGRKEGKKEKKKKEEKGHFQDHTVPKSISYT